MTPDEYLECEMADERLSRRFEESEADDRWDREDYGGTFDGVGNVTSDADPGL